MIVYDSLYDVSQLAALHRGETHVFVHCTFINLMKESNEKTLIFWYQHQTILCFDVVLVLK